MTAAAKTGTGEAGPAPLAPGGVIGILGGGQLGRMLALAAARLGFDTAVLTPEDDAPASRVAAHTVRGDYTDPAALAALASIAPVATVEFENVPAEAIETLRAAGVRVAPGPTALATAQDRLVEKRFFRDAGVMTAEFVAVDTPADIVGGLAAFGAPALLKTRREGYDGKGQVWVERAGDAEAAYARLGGVPAILEARVRFSRELSVIAARGVSGQIAIYPLCENRHEGGVLHTTLAPAAGSPALQDATVEIARRTLERLDYVGVLAIELFDTDEGLKVNEFAPRVHNSGHWTLDACEVDQFEQHVRAIAGWPLGPTRLLADARMENLLGEDALDWPALAADPRARLWLYGKRDVAAGRKMGHVTFLSPAVGRPRPD